MADNMHAVQARAIAAAVRRKTDGIPLLDDALCSALLENRSGTCFFTGHRDILGHGTRDADTFRCALRDWLGEQVNWMVYQGFSTFLCGGARGFDLLAAAEVLRIRAAYHPGIRLILLLPCREQTRGWNARDLALYLAVLERAEAYYIQSDYDSDCMFRRNRLMADLSSAGVAYYDRSRERSGTGMTVRYAGKLGIPMVYMPLSEPEIPADETGEDTCGHG